MGLTLLHSFFDVVSASLRANDSRIFFLEFSPWDKREEELPDGTREWCVPRIRNLSYDESEDMAMKNSSLPPPESYRYVKISFIVLNKNISVFCLDKQMIIYHIFSAYWKNFRDIFSALPNIDSSLSTPSQKSL